MDDYLKDSMQNAAEQAKHQERMRTDWDNLIGEIVQDGMEKGLFDNLPGKGKPLNLTNNHFEAGQALAHSILKENDIPPAWIMERNQVLAETAELRAEIERKWAWHGERFTAVTPPHDRDRLTISWDDACLKWAAQIEKLNKRIDTYNLKRPSANMELYKLNLEAELQRAGAARWLR
jgi:DnaJ family protein C protein 28